MTSPAELWTAPISRSESGSDFALGGLSEPEARDRLAREGANELPTQRKRGIGAISFEVVREPMFIMLVAAGTLYFVIGAPRDAIVLIASVFVVMAITVIQE